MPEHKDVRLSVITGEELDCLWQSVRTTQVDLKALAAHDSLEFVIPLVNSNHNPTPISSVLRSVRKRWSCFALREYPYFEMEFWNAYSDFYSHSFKRYDRACHRLHFFEGSEERAEELCSALVKGLSQKKIEDNLGLTYRGFTTFRPVESFVVGRTAIAFDERRGTKIPNHESLDLHQDEEDGLHFLQGLGKLRLMFARRS